MVSITPCLAKIEMAFKQHRLLTNFLTILLSALLLFNANQAYSATDKNINSIDITLSDEVAEAVNAGVEIIIQCDIAHRQSFGFFSLSEDRQVFRFHLQRNVLSNRFVVKHKGHPKPHLFRSLLEATNYIAAQGKLLLESNSTEQKPLSMRLFLNKFELPAPMRLNAFLSSAWAIDTGWVLWTYDN